MNHEQLVKSIKALKLHTLLENLHTVSMDSEKRKLSYEQFLCELLGAELKARALAKKKLLLFQSRINSDKTLESYKYESREGVTLRQMERLQSGDWVRQGSNVVLFGDIGVGKSHLAVGLVRSLCGQGLRCLFISTSKLIEDLRRAKQELDLSPFIRRLDKFDVLVCDELGFIPQNQEGGELFFQLIAHRYERKSMLITTNLPYSDWGKVFQNDITTTAAVDRIIHHCETLNIKGASGRSEEARTKFSQSATA